MSKLRAMPKLVWQNKGRIVKAVIVYLVVNLIVGLLYDRFSREQVN